jgi:hypothetical protein
MKPKLSFLLGSGFSVPENLPTVGKLNERLQKIDESEILIHSSQTAIFLNGTEDPNRHDNWDDRLFLQRFLEFYNSEVLKGRSSFHYEKFYDYYSGYLNEYENNEEIEMFYRKFIEENLKSANYVKDAFNYISAFNRTFNQLIAEQLHKWLYVNDVSYSNYPPYDSFINFLSTALETYDIKVHTLNHDLLFDFLGGKTRLWQNFSDGFDLHGSQYYGEVSMDFNHGSERVHKTYIVKLQRFNNTFDKPLCLFKLHGSINNLLVYTPQREWIRLKHNYGVSRFRIETEDGTFELLHDEVAPDFLSGTTNKQRYYTGDLYYINLFKHFEINLRESEYLIVIGYGFQDPGINDYIEKYFLKDGKKMIVIDVRRPTSNILDKYAFTFLEKSIVDVAYAEFSAMVGV